jgi:hypothetical protein
MVAAPTEGPGDPEAFARYGVFTRIPVQSTRVGLEISGIAHLTGEEGSLTDRTTHHAGASIALPSWRAAPEFYARVPLDDDLRDDLNLVLGLRVAL